MLVLNPTISTYFSAVDFDMCAHISAMRFVIRDANSANNCGSDDAGIVPALGLSLSAFSCCWRAPRNWKWKKSITSRAGKLSIARTNFLPARFLKHRHVSPRISQKLQYSRTFLGLVAQLYLITMLCCYSYQRMRWRWCNAFRNDARLIHVHLVFTLHNYKTPR